MNKNNLYAFYGSLRKGMYNFHALKRGMEYLRTTEIPGFKLFSLGSYPCAVQTHDEADIMTVDLFTVTGEAERGIHSMELGAGYKYREVEIDGTMFGIYLFDSSRLPSLKDRHVPGGDWVKHLQGFNEKAIT